MNKKLYITRFIISLVFLSIGGTFALVTSTMNGINITQIKSGDLTLSIDGGGSIDASFVPAKCTSENAIKKKIVAKATNTSGGKVSFSLGLDITSISDSFKRNTMRYMLTTNDNSCSTGIISGGSFKDRNTNDKIWLVKNDYDNITKSGNTYTKTYYLYIWLDEAETEYIEGNISVKLKGTTSNEPNLLIDAGYNDGSATNTLYYKIKSNADTTTRIDFSQTPVESNTNGIYTTTNTENGVPVYYYRGNVDNHLIFANYCWRIIRTTETSGVKLIYDGKPSNGECNNTGEDTTIGSSAFNLEYDSPAYVGYMFNKEYHYSSKNISSITSSVIFGNDVTYDASTNQYTLKDTYTLTDPSNWENEYQTIASKYHYTCFTSSDVCLSVYYIMSINSIYSTDKNPYYFTLTSGKNHLDILEEMLDDNNLNVKDSTIKSVIDTWYKDNMTNYTSKLEDTVFCNDRTYYNLDTSGWNRDYTNFGSFLIFSNYLRLEKMHPSLMCPRYIDKFTIDNNNGNGALIYPVGLITADEIAYAGGRVSQENTSYYLYNCIYNWTMSSADFTGWTAVEISLDYTGELTNSQGVPGMHGIRPVISLRSDTRLTSGNGTSTSPYIVE